jgi:uncharacterized membrane protein YvbJ
MSVCPSCGKENSQTEGTFCTFCGASLNNFAGNANASKQQVSNARSKASKELNEPYDTQRLENATKRVERLGYIVAVELAGLTVIIVLLMYTFNLF